MKTTAQNIQKPVEQPVFHKVAENLYRLESSGGYYALIKKSGKRFRRSLKTKDRKLTTPTTTLLFLARPTLVDDTL